MLACVAPHPCMKMMQSSTFCTVLAAQMTGCLPVHRCSMVREASKLLQSCGASILAALVFKDVSCRLMHPGCDGVPPDACAQQIQQFGGQQCGMVLSRTAELRREAKPLQCSRGHEHGLPFSASSDFRRCRSLQRPFRKLAAKAGFVAQYTALGCYFLSESNFGNVL